MAPGSEEAYVARLMTCHGCAERDKARVDLQDSPAEPGIHMHIERIT